MVNYKNGKIYKIIDLTNDNFYIGSTTKKYLSQRLEKHRTNYKCYLEGKTNYVSSYEILSNENYKIYLLENAPCASRDELRMREQYWIDRLNCIKMVNKRKAFIRDDEIKECKSKNQQKYYEKNKDKILKNLETSNKIKVQCPKCNSIIRKDYFKKHQQNKSCINALPHGLICELED